MRSTIIAVLLVALMTACGGGGSTPIVVTPPPPAFSIASSSTAVLVPQDGTHATATVKVTRSSTNELTVTQSGIPSGVAMQVTGGAANDQVLDFQVTWLAQAQAGIYPVTITVSDGSRSAQLTLSLTIAVSTWLHAIPRLHSDMFMSTSFQPADWSYQFFQTNTAARMQTLDNLGSRHINLQPMDGATDNLNPAQAGPLDFSKMDAIVQPVLQVTDQSPLLQLYAPSWMWVGGNSSNALVDPTFNQFADWAAMMVRYYNVPGGFTRNGVTYASPAGRPITWWGIFNEPNLTSLTPQQYVQLYNLTVQKMRAVDPTIKLVVLELSDFGDEARRFVPSLVLGLTQPVDALAIHFYGTCDQRDTDQEVIGMVQVLSYDVRYIRQQMSMSPYLASIPLWVTENNVNADFSNNGKSACNPTQNFVADPRGNSAFFAAWRSLVFSQLVDNEASSLHHWDYNADQQFGEVDGSSGALNRSYWVDYWISRFMTDPLGVDVLPVGNTQRATADTLAVRRPDASVVVMISNVAYGSTVANNGPGAPTTVLLDTSPLGTFRSASTLTIDAKTNLVTGPTESAITPAATMTVQFSGYGVTFIKLVP